MRYSNAVSVASVLAALMAPQAAFADSTAQPAASSGVETITVTAERREQSIQDVAAPIAALSGDKLQSLGITEASSLTQLVPALNISQAAGAFALFYIRGVGSFGGNSLSESATAFNYDSVYLSRASSTYGMYYDLQRVEVLKGPQGTLYGLNATGGAINIIPNKPQLGVFSSDLSVDYGNYNALTLTANVNIPIGDDTALRISGQSTNHDGYQSDGTSDEKGRAARVQLLSELTSDLDVRISADYFHDGGKGPGGTIRLTDGKYLDNDANIGLESPQAKTYFSSLFSLFQPNIFAPSRQENEFYGVNAEINYRTPIGTLTFIPAYRKADTDFVTNAPGFTIDQQERDEQTSAELLLASDMSGPFSYIVGGYYLDENIHVHGVLGNQPGETAVQIYTPHNKSWAGYAQFTYAFTDALSFTGGARYTNVDKTGVISQIDYPQPAPAFVYPASYRKGALTYKANLEYVVAPGSLVYASVESGFKAGGLTLSPQNPTYADETITAYTIGSKGTLLDGDLVLNGEAFWWQYENQQFSHLGSLVQPGGFIEPAFVTQNVGNAPIKGVDVESHYNLTSDLRLDGEVQYLDAHYTKFGYDTPNLAPFPIPPFVGPKCSSTYAPPSIPANPGIWTVNCAHAPLPFSSAWVITLGGQQTWHLGEGSLVLQADARYESSQYAGLEFLRSEYQPGVWTVDGSLTYNFPGDRTSVSAYVRNATDEHVLAQTFASFTTDSYVAATLKPPRTYGIHADFHF